MPARSTRWRRACSCSASTARPGCSPIWSGSTRSTRPPSGSASRRPRTTPRARLVERDGCRPRVDRVRRIDAGDRRAHRRHRAGAEHRERHQGRRQARLRPARAGEEVELAARPVTVSRFEVLGSSARSTGVVDLDVRVECSSGTYIRALARDLGAALGVGGHLTALRRTRDRTVRGRGRRRRSTRIVADALHRPGGCRGAALPGRRASTRSRPSTSGTARRSPVGSPADAAVVAAIAPDGRLVGLVDVRRRPWHGCSSTSRPTTVRPTRDRVVHHRAGRRGRRGRPALPRTRPRGPQAGRHHASARSSLVEAAAHRAARVAIVAPAVGNSPTGSLLEFYIYLSAALLIPPLAVVWALVERTRWSTVVLGVACLAVAVMVYRMSRSGPCRWPSASRDPADGPTPSLL